MSVGVTSGARSELTQNQSQSSTREAVKKFGRARLPPSRLAASTYPGQLGGCLALPPQGGEF